MVLGARIGTAWEAVRTSYWFVPTLMVAASMLVALVAVELDRRQPALFRALFWWVDAGEPQTARTILTTVATSMISIATLTFSITIMVLTLASSQFGSRLIYNFMRDRTNQFVLGAFIGPFTYSLLVLWSIGAQEEGVFVPHFAVSLSIVAALVGIGMLIYFIHHVAETIQASKVVNVVSTQLRDDIDEVFPPRGSEAARDAEPPALDEADSVVIPASRGGVLQAMDRDRLVRIAKSRDVVIRALARPGRHVIPGAGLVQVYPAIEPDDELAGSINTSFAFGHRRTLLQDVEFAFMQLVELAVRALSPGINDPFTAMSCIDEIGTALARIMRRDMPPRCLTDDEGRVRLVLDRVTFTEIVNGAFDQIRHHAASHAAVMWRFLEVIERLAVFVHTAEHREALLQQAALVHELAMDNARSDADRDAVEDRYDKVLHAFGAGDDHSLGDGVPAGSATRH